MAPGDLASQCFAHGSMSDAARLLAAILKSLEVVADDGARLVFAFTAPPALHDALCIWNAHAEDAEDDGLSELA